MAESLHPYGYKPDSHGVLGMGTMLTIPQLETMTTVNHLHPEAWRRYRALIKFAYTKGVPLGVGTGWRIQPDPPPDGFADPGNSWHESCPVHPATATALAIDTVPEPSWPWMFDHCAAYGLRTFRDVNEEPWHVQPIEIPGGRNFATTLPPMEHWELPEEEDVPLTDEDVKKIWAAMPLDRITQAVWAQKIDTSAAPGVEAQPARFFLHRMYLVAQQYMGGWNGKTAPDETMLERIDKNTRRRA